MICKICQKSFDKKFGGHVNTSHKMNLTEYFKKFPDQELIYNDQKPVVWNKGLTKETNESVAKYAEAIKIHTNTSEVRKRRSDSMFARYKDGDFLTTEQRAICSKKGSDGWVKKVKEATQEERTKMLANFTTAGNEAQNKRRELLTPEDYQRLYPFAKGKAQYYNCDHCQKQMIAWFGGKPRPKRRFCNVDCFRNYLILHPYVNFPKASLFYSSKMNVEFYLRSKLEIWFANYLDECDQVETWSTTPFSIKYEYNGRMAKYYPDFLVNSKYLIELKSKYIYDLATDRNEVKFKEARNHCSKNNLEFHYLQFDDPNLTKKKVHNDDRITRLFLG